MQVYHNARIIMKVVFVLNSTENKKYEKEHIIAINLYNVL